MPFGIHFGREIAPLPVAHVTVFREQRHRLHRECERGLEPLGVEPFHKPLLKPAQPLPVRLAAVREVEFAEHALEVVAVVIGYVPEYCLEVTRSRRLVDGIDNLLEAVGDDLVNRPLFEREIHHVTGSLVVIESIFLADEIVHVHQELRSCTCAAEHAGDDEYKVYEPAAERLEVGRLRGVSTDRECAVQQPRIHGDAGAVVCEGRLVIFVDEMVFEQLYILVRELFAVHFLETVAENPAVHPDESLLRELAHQGGDILILDIGVRIELASSCRVR